MAATTAAAYPSIDEVVKQYQLEPHPEGGYFKQWYASDLSMSTDLDASGRWENGSQRSLATAIWYLCPAGGKSALHRIKSDELWFWHAGLPLCVVELQPPTAAGQEAVVKQTLLGPLTAAPSTGPASAVPSVTHVVTGGTYFGAYCPDQQEGGYALVSCVVAPGFDYRDWSMESAEVLKEKYPGCAPAAMIAKLAKD